MSNPAPGAFPQHKLKERPDVSLLRAIVTTIPINESIMDIGAGAGWFVKSLRSLGYNTCGIDGGKDIEKITNGLIKPVDLTLKFGALVDIRGFYNWGLFIEVGEHIPREFEQVVIDNVSTLPHDGLIVSWGYPGQRGHKHINCRLLIYIASEFARRGWFVNHEATQSFREIVENKFYRQRIMVLNR